MTDKLIIGTANFGLKYGIANQSQISPAEIDRILTLAVKSGIWGVDTAKGYGNAERVLGNYIKVNRPAFKIITKLSLPIYTWDKLQAQVQDSLNKLHVSQLDYVLLHSFITYSKYRDKIGAGFTRLQKTGKIKSWGISVYHRHEVELLIEDGLSDIAIEFPLNLFDQRFLKGNLLKKLKRKKFQLFSRSVFLQGLFFLNPNQLSPFFNPVKGKLQQLRDLSSKSKLSISELALRFVASNELIDGIVCGVDSVTQLHSNLYALTKKNHNFLQTQNFNTLQVNSEDMILPYRWPKNLW